MDFIAHALDGNYFDFSKDIKDELKLKLIQHPDISEYISVIGKINNATNLYNEISEIE